MFHVHTVFGPGPGPSTAQNNVLYKIGFGPDPNRERKESDSTRGEKHVGAFFSEIIKHLLKSKHTVRKETTITKAHNHSCTHIN